jgi:hypothetical protein
MSAATICHTALHMRDQDDFVPLPHAVHHLRSVVGRLSSPPLDRAFSNTVGTSESPHREGVVATSAIAVVGSRLGLCRMASVLANASG